MSKHTPGPWLAWLFKRFDEGHLYIQNLICKAPKKANEK